MEVRALWRLVSRNILPVVVAALIFLAAVGGKEEVSEERFPRFVDEYGKSFGLVIREVKGDLGTYACSNFNLDLEDVKVFFKNAVIVDGYTFEKEYPWYPCGLEGSITVGDNVFDWEITPGGKAVINQEAGEAAVCLVCDRACGEIFPHGGNMFREE